MSTQSTEQRFENPSFLAEDYAKYKSFFQYLGAGTIVLILVLIGAVLFADIEPRINQIIAGLSGYLTNVYTEILSVVVTILILDRRAQHREEQRRITERNQRLIREIGSRDNATALKALREARGLDLLRGDDGLLRYTDLRRADLSRADLRDINLCEVNLRRADLSRANLSASDLSNADLRYADLSGAELTYAIFTKQTVLPDGTNWISQTDITQFTNPQHPNFWKRPWIRSGFHNEWDWRKAGSPKPNEIPSEG